MSERRRVMLLSPFFFPEMISTGRYNTSLAQQLVQRGWHVNVVCSHPLYPNWAPVLSEETLPGMTILRGGARVRYPLLMAGRRALLELWFLWHTLLSAWRLRSQHDIGIVVFPPSLAAAVLLTVSRKPWIGVVHDLQGAYASSAGGRLGRLIAATVRAVERHAFQRCRSLVFLSDSMRRRAAREYGLDMANCELMYPGNNVDEAAPRVPEVAALFDAGFRHVVYSGALGHKQNPEALTALMLRLLARRPDVVCHVFSAGPAFVKLRAETPANDRLRWHDLVPDPALATVLRASTVQVVSETPGASQGSIPSKLSNLMSLAVPVFAICDDHGDLAQLVQRSGIGHVDSSFDEDLQLDALAAFVDTAAAMSRDDETSRLRPLVETLFSFRPLLALVEACAAERALADAATQRFE